MNEDASSLKPPKNQEPVRNRDGREQLPEDMNQQLRDAVWAGLATRMQEDKELLCKKYGHQWGEGPDNTIVCQRCNVEKVTNEETEESSVA
jgi:hypothetical protein